MWKRQRAIWPTLTWIEWVMVIVGSVPGVFWFKSYLETLIYVVKMFAV